MICPSCQKSLTIEKNEDWFYCHNHPCSYAKGNDIVVTISIDKQNFTLPLGKDKYAVSFKDKNKICVRNHLFMLTGKEYLLPYFSPDLSDLSKTIQKIKTYLVLS